MHIKTWTDIIQNQLFRLEPAIIEAKHPIQVVARRTGLSTDVIRAWERRYQAISPQRAPNSRRLYSDSDV